MGFSSSLIRPVSTGGVRVSLSPNCVSGNDVGGDCGRESFSANGGDCSRDALDQDVSNLKWVATDVHGVGDGGRGSMVDVDGRDRVGSGVEGWVMNGPVLLCQTYRFTGHLDGKRSKSLLLLSL